MLHWKASCISRNKTLRRKRNTSREKYLCRTKLFCYFDSESWFCFNRFLVKLREKKHTNNRIVYQYQNVTGFNQSRWQCECSIEQNLYKASSKFQVESSEPSHVLCFGKRNSQKASNVETALSLRHVDALKFLVWESQP